MWASKESARGVIWKNPLISLARPEGFEQLFLRDDEITDFALRVTSAGAKSFVWEGRINGHTCRDTLGKFPDLSVVEARAKAFEYKAKIARGENPVGQRDAERAALTRGKNFRSARRRIPEPARETPQTILARR